MSKLKEIEKVSQEPDVTGFRRWFTAPETELVVWYHGDGSKLGFQLIYKDASENSYALTWKELGGYTHMLIDDGGENPLKNMSPALISSKSIPWDLIKNLFIKNGDTLEEDLKNYIESTLKVLSL